LAEGESADEVWQLATSTPTVRRIESMHSFAQRRGNEGMRMRNIV
jgi:hypothetical protein